MAHEDVPTGRSPIPSSRPETSTILEQAVFCFEQVWRAGGRPTIEEFLTADAELRRQVLVELVHTDLEYRLKKAGERARVEDYFARYPELADDRAIAIALIAAEHKHRRAISDPATIEEYVQRFPTFAEELRRQAWDHGATPLARHPSFEILEELGRGGMGVVYLAEQKALKRRVAVKMISSGTSWDAKVRARFQREAESVARLSHPNVVPIFEVGEHMGSPYFVMEYLEKGSLEKAHVNAPPSPKDAAFLTETLARALAVVHEAGIIHRDLKPANVLFARDGTPKIVDFGLARSLEPTSMLTASGAIVGTPNYMAPEQARSGNGKPGDAVSPRTDVYALGGILYRLLSGKPPHVGPTPMETLIKVVNDDVIPVRKLKPEVPRDLETVCMKCLEREPAKRYADAYDLAEDLARFRRGEPILARPISRLGRVVKWARRRKVTAVLTGSVLVLVLVTASAALWWWQRQAAMVSDVEALLAEALPHQRAGRWPEARALLERAEGRLGDSGPQVLRDLVRQGLADAHMVSKLEDIRLHHAQTTKGRDFDKSRTAAEYLAAFQEYGIDVTELDAGEAAKQIASSLIREPLIAALDHWMNLTLIPAKLREAADAADSSDWRRSVRDAISARDASRMKALAEQAEALSQPPAALAWLGNAIYGADSIDGAAALFRRAQRQYPNDFWINLSYGLLLNDPRKPRPDEAIGFLRAAVALRPTSAAVHNILAAVLQAKGDLDGAIEEYRQAISLSPGNALAHNNLGNALGAKGKLEMAMEEYRQAIAIDPEFEPPYSGLATVLLRKGRFDEAVVACRQAVALKPQSASLHYNLGNALLLKGAVESAIEEYRQAIALDPDFVMSYVNLGTALLRKDDFAGALLAYRQASAREPKRADLHNTVAWLLATAPDVKMRDAAQSIALAKKAIDLQPKNGNIWNTLGVAYYRNGDWNASIEALEKSMALRQGGDGSDWFFLAMANWQLGKKEEARAWHQKAVEWMETYRPTNEELVRFRAEAEQLLGITDSRPKPK